MPGRNPQLRTENTNTQEMNLHIQLFVIVLAFISYEAIAQNPYSFNSVVVPITKHTDTSKPLYSVHMMSTDLMDMESTYSNFLIDLDAPLIWRDCNLQWEKYPVPCDEYQCQDVQSTYTYKNPSSCYPLSRNPILRDWGYCSCPVNVFNPVTGSCDRGLLNYDYYTFNTSNGRNPKESTYPSTPTGVCASSSSSFQSFPRDVTGVMALSSSPYALPMSLYNPLKRIVALCLPSTSSAPGVLFTGASPYYILPNASVDITTLLSYTPLVKRPNSFEYFITVHDIVIKKKSINMTMDATAKLSTITPYTTLRSDIYNHVVKRFSKVAKQLRTAMPIAPFTDCYYGSTNSTKGGGLKVPKIVFITQDGKKWILSETNSMKQMTNDVVCLAFVDSGATSDPPITIGTFQFEDNFVIFDLENSTFGFSSSLLNMKTSCSNFNFNLVE